MRYICLLLLLGACATSNSASTASIEAMSRGDYGAALAAADRGLAHSPHDAWLLYDRGSALAGLGRTDEALSALDAAEQRFDTRHDRALAHYRSAVALQHAGRCREANREYGAYAALMRPFDEKVALAALEPRLCVSSTPEELAERQTRTLEQQAIDSRTSNSAQESTAAGASLAVRDYDNALAHADNGLALTPDDPWLLYDRGAALAGLQRTDEALEALQKAEEHFAADDFEARGRISYRRALALEVAGRCEEEQSELKHYASLVAGSEPVHAAAHLRLCKMAQPRPTI